MRSLLKTCLFAGIVLFSGNVFAIDLHISKYQGEEFYGSSIDDVGDQACEYISTLYPNRTYVRAASPLNCVWQNGMVSSGGYYIQFEIETTTCPAATPGKEEYDTVTEEGCGCSSEGQESLFDGEEGGEEGCQLAGVGGGANGDSGDGTKTPPCKDKTANPCQISTGAKFRNEVDFRANSLSLVRNYNSLNLVDIGFGKGWHNVYFKRLIVAADSIAIIEGNGRKETWIKTGNAWLGDVDSDYLLSETSSGFTVTLKRGDVHEYNLAGQLQSETDTRGKVTNYEYDTQGRLSKVTHHYGQFITLEYSTDGKNHITTVTDTSGVNYTYEYDANDNLIAVVYPDTTADTSDNPKRIYHYEDTRFPNHITGITNVDGDRYATFGYNVDGRAIESALAPTTNSVGQERVQLNYTGHGSSSN